MRRCLYCGCRETEHGSELNPHRPNPCPPSSDYGTPAHFPAWPLGVDDAEAEAIFDARLESYWTARATSFEPCLSERDESDMERLKASLRRRVTA